MIWVPILAVALLAFLFAIVALRLPRKGWALMGAVLLLGLAGYGMQGNPGMAGSPKDATPDALQSGEVLVEARRAMFDTTRPPPSYITVSDGFARRGRFGQAAQLLKRGLADNPQDGEAWLALATALVEHADGQVTPPALEAFERAKNVLPRHPGPDYFLGAAYLRSRDPFEARRVWAELLEATPEDAPWHADVAFRVAALDDMIAQMRQMQELQQQSQSGQAQ